MKDYNLRQMEIIEWIAVHKKLTGNNAVLYYVSSGLAILFEKKHKLEYDTSH